MKDHQFQQLLAALCELTEAQRQILTAALSGRGELAEVTSMIEARFRTQACCPHCQSSEARPWGRASSVMIQKFVTTRGKLLNELLDLNHTRRINGAMHESW
jgi:hypothetical protein